MRHDLERKLHGDAKKLLVGLITEHGEFYAEALRTQIDGSFRLTFFGLTHVSNDNLSNAV